MMKKSKNIILYLLYAIIFCVILGFQSTSSEAATSSTSFFKADSAPQYVSVVYTWGSMIVGGLSLIVIAYAGITYMRSMGNQEVISQSKTLISGALIGLFLVLGGYFLLRLMDPRLVELKISVPQATVETTGGADTYTNPPTKCETQSDCNNFDVPLYKSQALADQVFLKPVGTTCIEKECRVPANKVCAVYVNANTTSFQDSFNTSWGQKCQKGTVCSVSENDEKWYKIGTSAEKITWADGSTASSEDFCGTGENAVGCSVPRFKTCQQTVGGLIDELKQMPK